MKSSFEDRAERELRVLVFGGTTEGRELAQWLGERGQCTVFISSLTEYGGSLVQGIPNAVTLTGRMLPDRMRQIMAEHGFACVIDATHPYATDVSANISAAAYDCRTPVYRIVREGEPEGPWVSVGDAHAAARYVAQAEGNALLTTGSKDLAVYADVIDDFRERLYVRILPVSASIAITESLGIPASHVIAMQGPFSTELNSALIRERNIKVLVTKASGIAGGFWEKVNAARECGTELVVIQRPIEEEGLSLEQAKYLLAHEFGL